MSEKTILDEIVEALKDKKTPQEKSQLIDQLQKEKNLYETLKGMGLTLTPTEATERARLKPEGVVSLVEKGNTVDQLKDIAGTSATYKRRSDLTVDPAEYDLWIPASGKKVRLKQIVASAINNDTNDGFLHLKWGATADFIHYGGVIKAGASWFDSTNLVGCNIDGAVDQKLMIWVSGKMRFNAVVFGEEI